MVEHENALQFTRNSILLVENTYPGYVTGQWIAPLVDEQGGRSTRRRIPSKVTKGIFLRQKRPEKQFSSLFKFHCRSN